MDPKIRVQKKFTQDAEQWGLSIFRFLGAFFGSKYERQGGHPPLCGFQPPFRTLAPPPRHISVISLQSWRTSVWVVGEVEAVVFRRLLPSMRRSWVRTVVSADPPPGRFEREVGCVDRRGN